MVIRYETPARKTLEKLRDKLGGIGKLAVALGTADRSQVGRWLSGDSRPNPKHHTEIRVLARKHGVIGKYDDLDWLTEDEKRGAADVRGAGQ
jgi:hypothetical protein